MSSKLVVVVLTLVVTAAFGKQKKVLRSNVERLQREYSSLYEATDDKAALEAIRDLHAQLDGDSDGTIEPAETGEFVRGNQQYYRGVRGGKFHEKDVEITVKDLWLTWQQSEVHNWTAEQVADWVAVGVELPQYREAFLGVGVDGAALPKVAASPHYLSKVVGISSPIHRSKLTLKAMDVVLFGPPRDNSNFWKDTVLTGLLLLAVTGLFYAYHQNKRSKGQLKKMMADLDSLSRAEETLKDLQEQLQQKDSKIESMSSSTPPEAADPVEISRLKEELDLLRTELQRAEVELEDRCWVAPPVLQHWLQLTHEMESGAYNNKKRAAEEQLDAAKEACERLKRKRSSLVGAFVSTHGRSIDEVDRSILDAKAALTEVTRDLTERSQRWRQIEMLCGCAITRNAGIGALRGLVRHVGVSGGGGGHHASSRMSRSASQEDLDEAADRHSLAASSVMAAQQQQQQQQQQQIIRQQQQPYSGQLQRRRMLISREMSKESSSSSDEMAATESNRPVSAAAANKPLQMTSSMTSSYPRSSTPPVARSSPLALKRSRMVKSYSQDAGGSIQAAAAAVAAGADSMIQSVSEGQLQCQSNNSSDLKARFTGSKASVLEEEEMSCSASESGSLAELSRTKESKRRSFFHFRKKEKKVLM